MTPVSAMRPVHVAVKGVQVVDVMNLKCEAGAFVQTLSLISVGSLIGFGVDSVPFLLLCVA
jgi:hypothetical protein